MVQRYSSNKTCLCFKEDYYIPYKSNKYSMKSVLKRPSRWTAAQTDKLRSFAERLNSSGKHKSRLINLDLVQKD